jgi:NitT/TauT family transport system substrate-binding protein
MGRIFASISLGVPGNPPEVAQREGTSWKQGALWEFSRKSGCACLLPILVLLAALCGGAGTLSGGQETSLSKVSFIPQWFPQAQFAGYYVAQEKGFYRQHRLEVKILQGGPEKPVPELLAQGRANFGTLFLTDGTKKRARGLKLINIAQIVQRSALMLVAKKSSGISTPEDMNGKKVGLWPDDFRFNLSFSHLGLKAGDSAVEQIYFWA